MSSIEEAFGFDALDPQQQLALELVQADSALIDELIALRKEAGLSQAGLAELIGVSQPTVHAFERSGNDPRLSTIRRYALAVGARVTHAVSKSRGEVAAEWWSGKIAHESAPHSAIRNAAARAGGA